MIPASTLQFFRSEPPPPKVVLLPDALFFSRSVAIAPGATPQEASAQVELALEAFSPFPLNQLYYGWFWKPGAEQAFVFASYRRRFTVEQTQAWADAELVIPESAALFGGPTSPATAVILSSPEALTATYWETDAAPAKVVHRTLPPEVSEEDRARARDEVLRGFGGSRAVVDLLVAPAAEAAATDREIVFRSGEYVSRLPASIVAAMDVRDKGELAARSAARKRDVLLWRTVLGCAAAAALFALLELALLAGAGWHKTRVAHLQAREPAVQQIREAQDLALSIQDLVTKRFLPLEMVTAVIGQNAERKPGDVVITGIRSSVSAVQNGLYTIVLDLQTTNPGSVTAYRSELEKLPERESVSVETMESAGDRLRFRMTITFKPGSLTPQSA